MKKTEAGETVLYVNKYYEKNLTSGNVTTSYYLGSRLVAQREGEELRYIHQDHLSGTSLTTTDNGTVISSITYFPHGDTRSGDVPTDVKFTGQRLDEGTGLYYYGARYYDPVIGRFISADTIIPDPMNPQAFNRYTYCLNNPLKYVDPTGHWGEVVNGYVYNPITGETYYVGPTMSSWSGISNTYDETIKVWRSSFVSDITGGRIGGTNVATYRVIGNVSIDTTNNNAWLGMQISGQAYFSETMNPAYIEQRTATIMWEDKNGRIGSKDLQSVDTEFSNLMNAESTEFSYWAGLHSDLKGVPPIGDCKFIGLEVSFMIIESYAHDWDVEEAPSFIRRNQETIKVTIYKREAGWYSYH